MGEHADDLINQMIDEQCWGSSPRRRTKPISTHTLGLRDDEWKDGEGRVWEISKMEDSHLENCIRYLRNSGSHIHRMRKMQDELEIRRLPPENHDQDEIPF